MISTDHFIDQEGSTYRTIVINDQVRTLDNYRGTHYCNGEPIQKAIDDETYLKLGSSGKSTWCLNYNDAERTDQFGYLCNGFTVHDPREFAPKRCRVPSEENWATLEKNLETRTQDKQVWMVLMNLSYSGSLGIKGTFGGADKSGYWWKFMTKVASISWGRRLQSSGSRLGPIDRFQRFRFAVSLIKDQQ